jgi:hypothetical protein
MLTRITSATGSSFSSIRKGRVAAKMTPIAMKAAIISPASAPRNGLYTPNARTPFQKSRPAIMAQTPMILLLRIAFSGWSRMQDAPADGPEKSGGSCYMVGAAPTPSGRDGGP